MENALTQRIKDVISENGLNMTQFANCINFEQRTVNNYLNGKRKFSLEFVESIIRTFELDANWLLFGKENSKTDKLSEKRLPLVNLDYKEKWIELLQENIELHRKIAEYQEAEKLLENVKGGAVASARAV